ncbi:MAG: hypothetical protein SGJ27_12080 [Candidatus Melainabacteria bacterium]|nr:hypothetical protein [Candidatus Melainabacteria bacterium]
MLESFTKLRAANLNHRTLSASCAIALTAICASSMAPAHAVYDYSPDASLPDASDVATVSVTTRGDISFPKMDDDLKYFKTTLNERKERLGTIIAAGQTAGSITASQANALRSELDGMSVLEKALRGSKLSSSPNLSEASHVLQLAVHYDAMQTRLKQLLDTYETELVAIDPIAVMTGNKALDSDAAMAERAALETKISASLAHGVLNSKDGLKLRGMLNRMAGKEVAMRRSNGALEAHEQIQVDSDLRKVSAALKSSIDM